MSESFIRGNKDLEAKIRACNSAWDLQNMLAEVDATQVIRGAEPEQPRPENYAPLKRIVGVEDNGRMRRFLISGGSNTGLDVIEQGIRHNIKFGIPVKSF